MDFEDYIDKQIAWSTTTFGPGLRVHGLLDHISKELDEIASKPHDVSEWVDVVILALDGAWRSGHTSEQILKALEAKQVKNFSRQWPDWRTVPEGRAIEHIKGIND